MTNRDVTILLVEDDDGHARLIEKNLRRSGVANQLTRVEDGQAAVDFLLREGPYTGTDLPSPLLVMLDLNIPVLGGMQVLERMKADPRAHRIPVVVLTTTDDAHDVNRCYDLGCSVYVTKPVEYEAFCEAVVRLGMMLSVVTIPNGDYA